MMKKFVGLLLFSLTIVTCKGQTETTTERVVGGPCEDCVAALDYKLLNLVPRAMDTLPGFLETKPKIKITGTVFLPDGKTPAEDVLLYVYHTSREGIYEPSPNPVGWERRHGQYRGWLKTGKSGKFTFYTFRPAPYPQVRESEHIHLYIKEPNTNSYYIDNYVFEDDPTLTKDQITSAANRGGSGLIKLEVQNGIRDIILGLNIPDYD